MKRKLALLVAMILGGIFLVNAQPGGPRRTVEERVKIAHDKIDSAFKLDASKLAAVDKAFTEYYRGQDKVREDMMSSGERPSREEMMAKMKPLTDARDKELKAVLTDEQYKKWKEEIEPSLMPRRGGGGGGPR